MCSSHLGPLSPPPSIPDPRFEGGRRADHIQSKKMMKSAGILAVSMAAVNAISFVTTFKSINPYHQDGGAAKLKQRDYALDKFAPRFDGLRFIETLITAHR